MTLEDILLDIHACEEAIRRFERKYGIRSETFYPAYMSGEEPEDGLPILANGRRCIGFG